MSPKKIATLVLFASIALVAWKILDGTHTSTIHFRITVEGEQGGQKIAASAVWATRLHEVCELRLPSCDSGRLDGLFSGEAFSLGSGDDALWITLAQSSKLSQNGTMVPNPSRPLFLPLTAWGLTNETVDDTVQQLEELNSRREPRVLDIRFLPRVARFHHPPDPMSTEVVEYPFAGNVRIIRAYITFTDEPITRRIEQKLPWLAQDRPAYPPGTSESREGDPRIRVLNKINYIQQEL